MCDKPIERYQIEYEVEHTDALAQTLRRAGLSPNAARRRSADALLTIQGALVLARALDDTKLFTQGLAGMKVRLLAK